MLALRCRPSSIKGVRPLTSVELLDAAVWREIGSEEPQARAAFVDTLRRSLAAGFWCARTRGRATID
jgi:hypothetical protein